MKDSQEEYGERTGGRLLLEAQRGWAECLHDWDWRWYITLTFSEDVHRERASTLLGSYLRSQS
jgi:hypothetical protein